MLFAVISLTVIYVICMQRCCNIMHCIALHGMQEGDINMTDATTNVGHQVTTKLQEG